MAASLSPLPAARQRPWHLTAALASGCRASLLTVLVIAAINTGIAAVLWVDDSRPFWHPLWTCQLYGFSIAYCVNAARPWDRRHPFASLALAVASGTLIGVLLVILTKGFSLAQVIEKADMFIWNVFIAFWNGLFVSLFFLMKQRETRAEAALHKAQAARHLASRQVVEAELKMLQAQVEPHFLYNTLASVQFLVETDPPQASKLLTHLIDYLRAALPQLRTPGTTLGREIELARAYLSILQMRMGPRLAIAIDVPEPLLDHPFPPVMLITLVENAIQHGLEPSEDGGRISITARVRGDRLVVEVADTGCGLGEASHSSGRGVGLTNVRQRLAALFGSEGRFTLAAGSAGGAVATLELPHVAAT